MLIRAQCSQCVIKSIGNLHREMIVMWNYLFKNISRPVYCAPYANIFAALCPFLIHIQQNNSLNSHGNFSVIKFLPVFYKLDFSKYFKMWEFIIIINIFVRTLVTMDTMYICIPDHQFYEYIAVPTIRPLILVLPLLGDRRTTIGGVLFRTKQKRYTNFT